MIKRLLVANRGEIARRIIRSARSLGIECVAVHSDPDASAPHVEEADWAVALPGASPAQTYLRVDALLEAARRSGADAVHPGYGFLSEDAAFARSVVDAGLVWVGPPAEVIAQMGSKLAAKELMAAAGVPVLPQAEASRPEQAAALGWPVLVKASAGGGGRGMRVVRDPDELPAALEAASREAAAAFGDGTVFVEPYLPDSRHVEVQVFADRHGNVIHLFERDCSVQRRHQKVIEECPSPAVDPELRARLGEAAVAAARSVGYVGAGTVEFLLRPDATFAFLEMNTRLQVEHPVTEAVTGLDLVRLQLLVAAGHALPPLEPAITGHAIEARLYAEDPAEHWRPSTGVLHDFSIPGVPFAFSGAQGGPLLRVDSAVETGSEVGVHYDPLLAKVIAWAPSRAEAAAALAGGLRRAAIHGVRTNRDLLVSVLDDPEFLAGDADTAFLDPSRTARLAAPLAGADAELLHAAAAALATFATRRSDAVVLPTLPAGWRNNPSEPKRAAYDARGARIDVAWHLDRRGQATAVTVGRDGTDETPPDLEVRALDPEMVELGAGGVRRRYRVQRVPEPGAASFDDTTGARVYVDGPDGSSDLRELPRFAAAATAPRAGTLLAPLPGSVVALHVAPGKRVVAHDVLVTIEAMKMEHQVRADGDGVVIEILAALGDQVVEGQVLVVLDDGATTPDPS